MTQNNFISEQRIDAPELAALGLYAIGVRTLTFVNRDQLDFLNTADDGSVPTYDRPLTVEVWYPAMTGGETRGEYTVSTHNPDVQATLTGIAIRDAAVDPSGAPYPLVVISHGYPGNRFLLGHLAENLATKGYVVASIDHTDSLYTDQSLFISTLYNRPIDQHFVIESMVDSGNDANSFLNGMVDGESVGLIGYSMGGYGAVVGCGGALTNDVALAYSQPHSLLTHHQRDNAAYQAMLDKSRIRAVVAFAPWGFNTGFWNADSLKGIQDTPFLLIAGSEDDVSGYENGVRGIWGNMVNTNRHLLTYDNARHNAGAPMPAPREVTKFDHTMHYADNVWDSTRMNNIAQHFVTAFLGVHLKSDAFAEYLDVVPNGIDGVYDVDDAGNFTDNHTYWTGFQNRTAIGLRLEFLAAGS